MYRQGMCIVARANDYRDYDRMLTLISRDFGRIDALCRGCRKQGSPLTAASEPFCCGEYTFFVKGERSYVNQCEIKDSFFALRGNMEAFYVGSAITDISAQVSMPEQGSPRLFSLLINCLFALNTDTSRAREVFCFFVVKILDVQGQRPDLEMCAECTGKPGEGTGGSLCGPCADRKGKIYLETVESILHMRSIDILTQKIELTRGFESYCSMIAQHLLEKRLNSLLLLNNLLKL